MSLFNNRIIILILLNSMVASSLFSGQTVAPAGYYYEIEDVAPEEFEFELFEDDIPLHELEEFEDLCRDWERQIEIEEAELDEQDVHPAGNFLKKWGKKFKRWFKKQVRKILKEFLHLKKCNTVDDCAYLVVYNKRRIDKWHNTGSIDKLIRKIEKSMPHEETKAFRKEFLNSIEEYWNNPKKRPPGADTYNFYVAAKKNDDLNIPPRAIFGGLEISCAVLIAALPFPGCKRLACGLACHGANEIYQAWLKQVEDKEKRNAK